jgi:ABC-type multidrug transport system fused ATPase/permease subunit
MGNETEENKTIFEKIKNLYGGNTYMGRYGIDVMKTLLIIFLFILSYTYYFIQNNMMSIRREWPLQRCKPNIMPFAGWINAPEGTDPLEYTKLNFMECSQKMAEGVFEIPIAMVYHMIGVIISIFKNALMVIENMRLLLNRIREALGKVYVTIMLRIQNFVIPFQNLLIKMSDFFEKIKGILATFIMTFLGVLWTFYSLIGSIYELIIIILIVMIIVIIVLWYIPFVGWSLALAAIIIFLTIAIPLIMLGTVSKKITKRRGTSIPSP